MCSKNDRHNSLFSLFCYGLVPVDFQCNPQDYLAGTGAIIPIIKMPDTYPFPNFNGAVVKVYLSPCRSALHDVIIASHWRHNDHVGVSNHQPRGCLLNRLFMCKSKKTSKLRVTGLCAGNSPGPVNSPHKAPVKRKMVPFDDVIMEMLSTLLVLVPLVTVTWIPITNDQRCVSVLFVIN